MLSKDEERISAQGYKWELKESDERTILFLMQKLGIDEFLARIMVNRGVTEIEQAENFLNPTVKALMPNPMILKDIDKAIERIISAINNKEKITILGDYDVDGASSSALLKRFLNHFTDDVDVYIPHRIREGYGPNVKAISKIHEGGTSLLITVDCGTLSFEPISRANELGVDVIVVDHHLGAEVLPDAYAIVNPNRIDDEFPYKSLAAVGVVFFLITALRMKMREEKFFEDKKEPDLMQFLDLVALGTVCDVMQLQGINRAFVKQGLKLINMRKNKGISSLANIIKLDKEIKAYHLGYTLGPRINAGGRIGEGILGSELLSTNNNLKSYKIAYKLDQLNEERKEVESKVMEEIEQEIEQKKLYLNNALVLVGEDWHLGILGILASKIKEKYKKPTAVISIVDGIGKGSIRSIDNVDIGNMLSNAKNSKILIDGGGHSMAGGFNVKKENIAKMTEYFEEYLEKYSDSIERAKILQFDANITISTINQKFIESISQASPFGNGNALPKFSLQNVKIISTQIIAKKHILAIVSDESQESKTLKCILFQPNLSELGEKLLNASGKNASFIGTIQEPSAGSNNGITFVVNDFMIDY